MFKGLKNKAGKRIARGINGKGGKTAGRGMNGQKSRAGSGRKISTLFEGGQTPLFMKTPKRRGFKHNVIKALAISTTVLSRHFKDGDTISPASLIEQKLIKENQLKHGIKIIKGAIVPKFTYEDVKVSESLK